MDLKGHTDSIGTSDYNQKLSERRAAAAQKLLVRTLSIDANEISVRGFDEERLTVTPESPATRRLNRRVEATVTIKRLCSR